MTTRNNDRNGPRRPLKEVSEGESLDDLLVTGRLCTPDEVAAMLRVSSRTLADWRTGRSSGDTLPFLRVGGRVMYLLRDVNAFLLRRIEAAEMRRDAGA